MSSDLKELLAPVTRRSKSDVSSNLEELSSAPIIRRLRSDVSSDLEELLVIVIRKPRSDVSSNLEPKIFPASPMRSSDI